MAEPVSHKLIVRPDGRQFIITGNPTVGYHCDQIVKLVCCGQFKRSWQAVAHAHSIDGASA